MPETQIVVDCMTGEQTEVEMTPEEETALLTMREAIAEQEANRPPSRDERLLTAVEAATTAVSQSKAFTAEQKALLAGVFDGLGQAITGGGK